MRKEIAFFSLEKAAKRIENSIIKRMEEDPLEEEANIEKEINLVSNFEMIMCQFADSGRVTRGIFSPNSLYYATAGGSGECQIWHIPSCQLASKLIGHINRVNDIVFHPQAFLSLPENAPNIFTASSDNSIKMWNFAPPKEAFSCVDFAKHEDRVNRIVVHPLGKYFISTSHDKT